MRGREIGAALIAGAAAIVLALGAGLAPAMEIEGVKLPDKVKLGDAGPELVLNGASW
jgi:hypothetical protein